MTDSKSKSSGNVSKESSDDKQAPASKEAENQASEPEFETGESRLLGGPTQEALNPAYASDPYEGQAKKGD